MLPQVLVYLVRQTPPLIHGFHHQRGSTHRITGGKYPLGTSVKVFIYTNGAAFVELQIKIFQQLRRFYLNKTGGNQYHIDIEGKLSAGNFLLLWPAGRVFCPLYLTKDALLYTDSPTVKLFRFNLPAAFTALLVTG